jgi:endoglucanase
MNDTVVGGWYDAGDTLKLNFPLAPTVSLYAWSLLEFTIGYETAGYINEAFNNVMLAADYLLRSHDVKNNQYIGQIGDPSIDHAFWGRPEQERNYRPALVYTPDMKAADLYGAVSAALASSSLVFRAVNSTWADLALASAIELYQWGVKSPGKYSDYYKKQTYSIYPSGGYHDRMAWAAGWLYRATQDTTYLDDALAYFTGAVSDVYPGWDSLWAPHAMHMYSLVQMGVNVPGADVYQQYIDQKFLRAWLVADGYLEVIRTPLGLVYPKWSEWGNLQFSTTVSAILAVHAKYTYDPVAKAADMNFIQTQLNYVMGGVFRSFVVGYGYKPPLQPAHAAASCPNMPAPCGWPNFPPHLGPNPQVIYGALVGGPMGVRKNATYPDFAYNDKRSDYVSNEVANDYNVGLAFSLAALYQMLP